MIASVACVHGGHRIRAIDYLALCSAAETGDELLVRALLGRGAPVNALAPNLAGDLSYIASLKNTPLQSAAEKGHLAIVRLLVAKGARIDAQCCDSLTPLGLASRAGHADVVQLLLVAGADAQRAGGEGRRWT